MPLPTASEITRLFLHGTTTTSARYGYPAGVGATFGSTDDGREES